MLKNTFFYALFILATACSVQAQQPCGTFEESKWLDQYFANPQHFAEADTPWLYVPVTMQIVGNDAGSGYFSKLSVFRALCNMNHQYEASKIHFYLHPDQPFIYLNNTSWYEHNWDGGDELINENLIPDRLNAFVVGDPAGNCGYSWQDAIVLSKSCSGSDNSTWSHEAGHHFSLPHTFRGWEGSEWNWNDPAPAQINGRQVEKVDGSNCATAGDRFCDTEPDYISNRWSCNGDARSFPLTDPNGDSFRADGTLFMSYANDECATRFSNEQTAAMRANLLTEHSDYLVVNQPGPTITETVSLVSPADSAIGQFDNFELSWEPVPHAQYYLVEISLGPNFPQTLYSQMVETTQLSTNRVLPKNRYLYWRVRPFGQWSFCTSTDYEVRAIYSGDATSTNDLERKTTLNLMPNPIEVGNPLTLELDSEEKMSGEVAVFDLQGKMVLSKSIEIFQGENRLKVDTASLPKGAYRLVLRNQSGNIHRPFIVI